MRNRPLILRTIKELRIQVQAWKADGLHVGLVPTMGALHAGHLSLVDEISKKTDRVIASIFVNPTQFAVGEDLESYPRNEADDVNKLANHPCDLVFAPDVTEMYPEGFQTTVSLTGVTKGLEGASRPGHFDSVATVVSKLINQCMPDVAIFGEKDYQQLQVIRRFVRDLNINVEIIGGKLVREDDGLAMSSRNVYLSANDRAIAGQLNVILRDLVQAVEAGAPLREAEAQATRFLLKAGFKAVDYVSIRDAQSLEEVSEINRPARVLAVARIGKVRLLDNMAIEA